MALNFPMVVIVVALTLCAAWVYSTAQRLHRLHIRLDRSRDALQAALDRRCAVAAVVYPELSGAAADTERVALTARDLNSRLVKEDQLTAALRQRGGENPWPAQLQDAHTRVELALRFYNDAVADTRALRLRPAVRALRLGGTAALPDFARGDR